MKLITIKDNEPYLRQISACVEIGDTELESNISILDSYCKEHEVMAMASVQFGIPKRIIYLKNTDIDIVNKMQFGTESEEEKNANESRILINPVITKREGLTTFWEACASCLNNVGLVKRPNKIHVKYLDRNMKEKEEVFEGFESTVLLHEYDHLNGILHIDIAIELYELEVEKRKLLRQSHTYEILSTTGNFDDLKDRIDTNNRITESDKKLLLK